MELYLSRLVQNQEDPNKEPWIRFPKGSESEIKIGRSSELPVRLLSAHVSRSHAVLTKKDDNFFIMDLNSLNGIHINDQRIKADVPHLLKKGDKVEIGRPDTEEVLKTMGLADRFIYLVKAATTENLDAKHAGPRQHISSLLKRHVTDTNSRGDEKRAKLDNNNRVTDTEKNANKNLLPTSSKNQNPSPDVPFKKEEKVIPRKDPENQSNDQALSDKPHSTNLKRPGNSSEHMVEENKRLKLELEMKEKELIKEREDRSQKLRFEQEKLAERYEKDYKSQLEQKEEELEMRLQLEKDIAVEQCKSAMPKTEDSGKAIAGVVDAMENELQCSICSELFIVATTFNCAHTFCQYCISEWQKVKSECPVCRTSIKTLTRSLVLDNYIDKALLSLSDEMRENRTKLVAERLACVAVRAESDKSRTNSNRRGRGRGQRARGRPRQVQQPSRPRTRSSIIVVSDADSSDSSNSSLDSSDSSPDSSDSSLNSVHIPNSPSHRRGYIVTDSESD